MTSNAPRSRKPSPDAAPGVDPRLIPFLDALAELLVAEEMRRAARRDDDAESAPPE